MGVRCIPSRATKDGRMWEFYFSYRDVFGERKSYHSKKYMTKEEAEEACRIKMSILKYKTSPYDNPDITFGELYQSFREFQEDKVKYSTKKGYSANIRYFRKFLNIKVKDLNIEMFEQWHKDMNQKEYADRTKNGALKFLKTVLNYGMKWYNSDCKPFYMRLYGFRDPNKLPDEMDFYTISEFRQFISVEDDLKYRCLFKVLYYCGLRMGEMRGLTWDNIDFKFKTIRVNKNVVKYGSNGKSYTLTSPKTLKSIRTLPLPDGLLNELYLYKQERIKDKKFEETWFVFGAEDPIPETTVRYRKNDNAKKAKVKQIRIHDFRHSCVSLLINSGANITLVATYMGHSKIDETLNTYAHLYRNTLDGIVNIMNDVDSSETLDELDLCRNNPKRIL
jgi:integrase